MYNTISSPLKVYLLIHFVSDILDSDKEEVEDPQIEPCTIISKKATLIVLKKLRKYILKIRH